MLKRRVSARITFFRFALFYSLLTYQTFPRFSICIFRTLPTIVFLHSLTDYLVHAKCYHELADDYKRCAQVYYENEKARVETVRESNDINLELRLWCWWVFTSSSFYIISLLLSVIYPPQLCLSYHLSPHRPYSIRRTHKLESKWFSTRLLSYSNHHRHDSA